MPIYEYQCSKCKSIKEVIRGIKEPEVKPVCDFDPICPRFTEEMERVITPVGFVLKGSCWAKDGYTKK